MSDVIHHFQMKKCQPPRCVYDQLLCFFFEGICSSALAFVSIIVCIATLGSIEKSIRHLENQWNGCAIIDKRLRKLYCCRIFTRCYLGISIARSLQFLKEDAGIVEYIDDFGYFLCYLTIVLTFVNNCCIIFFQLYLTSVVLEISFCFWKFFAKKKTFAITTLKFIDLKLSNNHLFTASLVFYSVSSGLCGTVILQCQRCKSDHFDLGNFYQVVDHYSKSYHWPHPEHDKEELAMAIANFSHCSVIFTGLGKKSISTLKQNLLLTN